MLPPSDSAAGITLGFDLGITDPQRFREFLAVSSLTAISPEKFTAQFLAPEDPAAMASIRLDKVDLAYKPADQGKNPSLRVQLDVVILDADLLRRSARAAYVSCWSDSDWQPRNPKEAVFELLCGSNANASPDTLGFEFVDFDDVSAIDPDFFLADTDVAEADLEANDALGI